MARRKSPPEIVAKLARFALVGISAKCELSGAGTGRIDLVRKEEIVLETIDVGEGTEFCRVVVRLNIVISGRREKDTEDVVQVTGSYEGRFGVQPGVTIAVLDEAAAGEKFQYGLVSQIYPLAMSHMRDQLLLMGLTTRHMPIGF